MKDPAPVPHGRDSPRAATGNGNWCRSIGCTDGVLAGERRRGGKVNPINRYIRHLGFLVGMPGGKPAIVRTYPIVLDDPVHPKVRWSRPFQPNPRWARLLDPWLPEAEAFLEQIVRFQSFFRSIPEHAPATSVEPRWRNDYIPPLDAMSIYSAIASRRPATFLEIGSGNSTKFARKAITDHSLSTKIVSVDPSPKAEVDVICDQVIRKPLEEVDLGELVGVLKPGDVLFYDGSHRCFQNSDVTVFFTELLWGLPRGVLIGIHDIFLPFDYPEAWVEAYYSEQYVLLAMLLGDGGHRIKIELPCHHAYHAGLVDRVLENIWPDLPKGIQHNGGCFWFSIKTA